MMAAPIVAALVKYGLPLLAQAVASKGKEWVEEKTGVELPDLVAAAPSPEVLRSLRELEVREKELLLSAEAESEKTAAADRDSARKREIELANSGIPHIGKITTPVLAIFTVVGFFAVLTCLLYAAMEQRELASGLREVLYIMLGVLGAQTTQVYNYYFGSSSGSAQKNFQQLLGGHK
jgi:hypothetical protein